MLNPSPEMPVIRVPPRAAKQREHSSPELDQSSMRLELASQSDFQLPLKEGRDYFSRSFANDDYEYAGPRMVP